MLTPPSNLKYKSAQRFIKIAIATALASFALASCQTTNSTEPSEATASAASVLSTDSTNYPNACMLDSATLKTELGLSDAQVSRIVQLRDSLRASVKLQIDAANGDRVQIHTILENFEVKLRTELESALTADQLVKLKALIAARGDGNHERDGGFRDVRDGRFLGNDSLVVDSAMLAHLTVDLSLTVTQTTQIKSLADSLNADTTVVEKQDAFMTGLKTILTSAQLATLESLVDPAEGDEHHGRGDRGGHHD